jgi:hypothetical protein
VATSVLSSGSRDFLASRPIDPVPYTHHRTPRVLSADEVVRLIEARA